MHFNYLGDISVINDVEKGKCPTRVQDNPTCTISFVYEKNIWWNVLQHWTTIHANSHQAHNIKKLRIFVENCGCDHGCVDQMATDFQPFGLPKKMVFMSQVDKLKGTKQ